MNIPANLTDEQMYVLYATQFANIDVRLQDLVNAARSQDPDLIGGIIADWQKANINAARARLRLMVNQGDAVKQLTVAFLAADKSMNTALQDLQDLPARIASITNLINKAVGAGASLIEGAPKKPDPSGAA